MPDIASRYLVEPGKSVKLKESDANDDGGWNKDTAAPVSADDLLSIEKMQEELFVSGVNGVLIVLQGMDASGKDGVLRHLLSAVNPMGCRVVSFKVPTDEEAAHDYLWRIHKQVPRIGEIVAFNRSHYESLLVERVHKIVPESVWKKRYDEINEFERVLTRSGTIILKFFLHISKDEQGKRLEARRIDPAKRWKVSAGDWRDNALWDEFKGAYEDVLSKTSTEWAPWHRVPADKKWVRNLVVANAVRRRFQAEHAGWEQAVLELGEKRLAEFERARSGAAK